MLLWHSGGFEDATVIAMTTKAKNNYVDARHPYTIFQLHSKNPYKDGSWKTYITVDGKRKEVVRKTLAELYDVLFSLYKAQDHPTITFEDVFNQLRERKLLELSRDQKTVEDDTYRFRCLSKEIRQTPVSDITEGKLQKWFVTSYMPMKPKESALRKMIGIINQVFDFAISCNFCSKNPARFIKFNDYAKDCDLVKKSHEERAFSRDEAEKLREDALKTTTNQRYLIRLLAQETGMRAAELCALHKSDVIGDYLHVHRQIVKDLSTKPQTFREVGYTKDERQHPHNGRYIPKTPVIVEVLKLAEQLPGDSEYLFHDKDGRFVSPETYERHLRRACSRLGIGTRNNHAFRIAFNSLLIEKDLSPSDRAPGKMKVDTQKRVSTFLISGRIKEGGCHYGKQKRIAPP